MPRGVAIGPQVGLDRRQAVGGALGAARGGVGEGVAGDGRQLEPPGLLEHVNNRRADSPEVSSVGRLRRGIESVDKRYLAAWSIAEPATYGAVSSVRIRATMRSRAPASSSSGL